MGAFRIVFGLMRIMCDDRMLKVRLVTKQLKRAT